MTRPGRGAAAPLQPPPRRSDDAAFLAPFYLGAMVQIEPGEEAEREQPAPHMGPEGKGVAARPVLAGDGLQPRHLLVAERLGIIAVGARPELDEAELPLRPQGHPRDADLAIGVTELRPEAQRVAARLSERLVA